MQNTDKRRNLKHVKLKKNENKIKKHASRRKKLKK
jgi:hypothetical protein